MPFLRKNKRVNAESWRVCGRLFELRGLSTSPIALRVRVWEALIAMKDMTTLPTYFFFENDREDDIFHVEEDVVVLSKTILDRRRKLIENLVRRCRNSKSVESVVGLASDLRLSEDVVRVEATLSLYCRGCDEEAETNSNSSDMIRDRICANDSCLLHDLVFVLCFVFVSPVQNIPPFYLL